jgi:predicted RNA methylase
VFTLSYHSPSLAPGNTPYVPDEVALAAFLHCIETVLDCFQNELGGGFTTLAALDAQARAARALALGANPQM